MAGGDLMFRGAILAAMILVASPAWAECSLEDLGKSFWGTVIATKDCNSVCDSKEACDAAIALDAALAMVALQSSDTGKGQALVDQFCKEAQGTADQVVSTLNTIFSNSIAESVLGNLSKQLGAIGSAAMVVKCSCETEQSTNALGADVGECLQEGLCSAQQTLGIDLGYCDCTPPPPQIAHCGAVDVKACEGMDLLTRMKHPECIPASSIANSNPNWQNSTAEMAPYRPSIFKVETPEGTTAVQLPPSAEGTGCGAVQSCFCPKPMEFKWWEVANPGSGDHRYLLACDCPTGTHPGAQMPSGISSCLCDETNQIANFGFAPFGMCPPPACPPGQTRLGVDGKCVTPCSDPTLGMAIDGSCCNPAQMSSCGQCCPPNTMPDPKSGACVPRPPQPK